MIFNKVNSEFFALENMGFVEKEFFEISTAGQELSVDEIFEHFIKSDVFWDKGVIKKYENNKVVSKTPYKFKSCFNDKINKDDFQKISFLELKHKLNEISKEESWGADLVVFNKLKEDTISWIKENSYSNKSFFFIYSDELDNNKLIDPNFFDYYILYIIIDKTQNSIIIIHHGED